MAKNNIRKKLVTAIVEYSSDELDEQDYIRMAKESEEQLLDRLINILRWYQWYHNELNN
jgi:hypothetical protein